MNKITKVLATICLSLFTLSACSAGKMETAINDNYTISYPAGWTAVDPNNQVHDMALRGPKPKVAFLVHIENVPASTSLDEYVKVTKQRINTRFTANMLEGKPITVNGENGYQIVFFATRNDKAYRMNENYFLKGNKIYTLNYTSPIKDYDKNLAGAEKIINSFTFN